MKVSVQWCCDPPGQWSTHDLSEWRNLPDKGRVEDGAVVDDQPGLLAHAAVNGLLLGEDHVRLDPSADGTACRFSAWSFNAMENGSAIAKVWELSDEIDVATREWIDERGNHCKMTNKGPRARCTCYCDPIYHPEDPGLATGGEGLWLPWTDFDEPADDGLNRHGVLVSDELREQHTAIHGPGKGEG